MTKNEPAFIFNSQANILVVEDHRTTRKAISQALELMGHQVEDTGCGSEALAKISSKRYDLILLDLQLPKVSGVEVMTRAHELQPDLLVIILTAYATVESAIAAVKTGAVDYLLKPCSNQEIGKAVRRALKQQQEQLRQERLLRTISEAAKALQAKEERGSFLSNHQTGRVLRCGCVTLNYKNGVAAVETAQGSAHHTAELTPREADLLAYLIRHPDTALSCQELAEGAFGCDIRKTQAEDLVRPHIYRLRKKIEPDPANPQLIQTRRGRGYIFSPF